MNAHQSILHAMSDDNNPKPIASIQQIIERDAEYLTNGLEEECAHRAANNLPPFWFERLFGFNVKLWQSISPNEHDIQAPANVTK